MIRWQVVALENERCRDASKLPCHRARGAIRQSLGSRPQPSPSKPVKRLQGVWISALLPDDRASTRRHQFQANARKIQAPALARPQLWFATCFHREGLSPVARARRPQLGGAHHAHTKTPVVAPPLLPRGKNSARCLDARLSGGDYDTLVDKSRSREAQGYLVLIANGQICAVLSVTVRT